MNDENKSRLILVSSIISFILIFFAILAIAKNPTKGYEVSIYSATPLIFWIAIIFSTLNGISIIVLNLYNKIKSFGRLGIFMIISGNVLMLSLYALRGYIYIERSDALSYIGYAEEVTNMGSFSKINFYPITSILISQIHQMTNISHLTISQYLPSFMYVYYYISIYLFIKSYSNDKKYILATMLASTPIFFAWFAPTIHHMLLGSLNIVFFLYLAQKSSDIRFKVLSIIYIIIFPFYHPVISIIVITYLFVIFISNRYFNDLNIKVSTTLFLLSLVSVLTWFTSQYMIMRNVKAVYEHILISTTPTSMDQATVFVAKLGLLNAIKSYLLMNTDEIVYNILALIAIYFICVTYKKDFIAKKIFPILLCWISGSILFIGIFLFSSIHTPYRLLNLNPIVLITPFLVGYLVYIFIQTNNKSKSIIILTLIVCSLYTSYVSLYPSPITMLSTPQVTSSEIAGMKWLLSEKNIKIRTADEKLAVFRFEDLIYGSNSRLKRNDLERDWTFKSHFGAFNDTILPIDRDRYLVMSEYVVKSYTEVWAYMNTFNQNDFNKIDNYHNVNKLYDNDEFSVHLIYRE